MKKILAIGRLKDRKENTTLISVHADNDVLQWIEENSSGNKQLVFNYLMQEGIKAVEEMNETVIVEGLKSQT
jgi:hypothetical protein